MAGEKEEGVFTQKEEIEGGFRRRFNSARRRREEIRRMRSGKGEPFKRIRSSSSENSSSDSASSSSSSSSPPSSSSTPSAAAIGAAGVGRPSVSHGVVALVGKRREMEDAVAAAPAMAAAEGRYEFFGVYDGHGGARVAAVCRERMHVVLGEVVGGEWPGGGRRWEEVMVECFGRVDREVAAAAVEEAAERTVGSTAVVVVVGEREIVVANCGDSRAVLSRGGVAVPLSSDHKPDRPDEMERVEAAGGRVINWGGYRVLGVLATSRSIGDYYLKPYVSSEPEVTVTNRTEKDEFLILASDGLWDVIPNDIACRITRQCLSGRVARMFPEAVSGSSAAEAAAFLAELAMSRGSTDNISVIVVELRRLNNEAR